MSTSFLNIARYDDARFMFLPDDGGSAKAAMTNWQGTINGLEFVGAATMKEISGRIQLPHSYKEGSDIVLHLHWGHKNAGATANVVWNIEWWWANVNGTGSVTTSVTSGIACASTDANKHLIADVVTAAGSGFTVSSLVMARIFRDPTLAADTYTDSVWLLDADAHVIYDSLGSNSIASKA